MFKYHYWVVIPLLERVDIRGDIGGVDGELAYIGDYILSHIRVDIGP